jgi:hypothetical protein
MTNETLEQLKKEGGYIRSTLEKEYEESLKRPSKLCIIAEGRLGFGCWVAFAVKVPRRAMTDSPFMRYETKKASYFFSFI